MIAMINERRSDIERINNDLEELRIRLNNAQQADEQALLEMVDDFYTSNPSDAEQDEYSHSQEMQRIERQQQIVHSRVGGSQIQVINDEDERETAVSDPSRAEGRATRRRTASEVLQEEQRRFNIRSNLLQSQKNELDRQIRAFTVEMHKKYSLALACLIMFLVGLPIGMMTKTSGIGVAFVFSSIVFSVYYAFLVLGEEMGKRGQMNAALSMWLPCILFFALSIFLIYIARKEKSFDVMVLWNWVVKRFKGIGSWFKRRKNANPR
jgi:lipopolysaccharide export LptBFGC system permease protein LptF